MRNWLRIYRLYGIRPFGLLIVVVLVFALILDKQSTRYDAVSKSRQELKADLEKKRGKVARQAEDDKLLAAAQAKHAVITPRLAAGETPESINLAASLSGWLSGHGLREVSGAMESPVSNADGTFVGARMTFKLLPQNLVKMLRQLSSAPSVLRIPEIELSVANITAPSELQGNARFEAVYLAPAPEIEKNEVGKGRAKTTPAAKTTVAAPSARQPAAESSGEANKGVERRRTPTAAGTSITPRAASKP